MLLMGLDPGTAAELLKSAQPDVVTAIAAELAYLHATGGGKELTAETAREFFGILRKAKGPATGPEFVKRMLESAVGKDRSPEMLRQVEELVQQKDPFLEIRSVESLRGEALPVEGAGVNRLRRVALLLRGLALDFRKAMLEAIQQQDAETCRQIQRQMVDWEDLPVVDDRAVQEALRAVDARKLALAMVGADAAVNGKVRSNISERAAAMLEEETSLLTKPKPEDIAQAREAILQSLRELNEAGMLEFTEA
jgi:flagellar motor switch protein FliG